MRYVWKFVARREQYSRSRHSRWVTVRWASSHLRCQGVKAQTPLIRFGFVVQQAVQQIHNKSNSCNLAHDLLWNLECRRQTPNMEYLVLISWNIQSKNCQVAVDLLYPSSQSRKRVYMTSYYVKWQQVTHQTVVRAVALATTKYFITHSRCFLLGLRLCFVSFASATKVIKVVADTADISAKRTSSSYVSDIFPQLINLFWSSQLLLWPSRLANPQQIE